ncbi:hypothetical protein FC15_GL000469 [Lapidilactobacillus concavus DSM 17758]|uniref:Uncharacterized protein n=1 Tax=Lapidilactobacillus concavus DSM 17758 TaxID=1423735 RepID=A0A0R1VS62_9LACO|nr:LiaF domain-containing protein [Lapidilactobacillus concavus]KRM08592.1 hypothetical protein FC15_GL000469 [Lapidilactobacillus concavus DSM 17758]GEL14120.1 hypothetical protein LCO01nite_16690 [Lapidilactobacillus concavus]
MNNTKTKWGHWFWGLFFLVCAFIVVASKMNLLSYHPGFWTLAFTFILAAAAIKSFVSWSFFGGVFSLAFISILYAQPLGIKGLVPWTVLGVALLISIGLSLVFQPLKRKYYHHRPFVVYDSDKPGHRKIVIGREHIGETGMHKGESKTDNESNVDVNIRLGSTIRYIQSQNFQRATVNMMIGEAKLYFDQAIIIDDPAVVEIYGNIGEIDLYFPKTWDVQTHFDTFIGDLEEKGLSTKTGPVVHLIGHLQIGEITIHYI